MKGSRAAENQREYRRRQDEGVIVVPCEVDYETINVMVAEGILPDDPNVSRKDIATGLQKLIRSLMKFRYR